MGLTRMGNLYRKGLTPINLKYKKKDSDGPELIQKLQFDCHISNSVLQIKKRTKIIVESALRSLSPKFFERNSKSDITRQPYKILVVRQAQHNSLFLLRDKYEVGCADGF